MFVMPTPIYYFSVKKLCETLYGTSMYKKNKVYFDRLDGRRCYKPSSKENGYYYCSLKAWSRAKRVTKLAIRVEYNY
jgi:hypothetical protein